MRIMLISIAPNYTNICAFDSQISNVCVPIWQWCIGKNLDKIDRCNFTVENVY